MGEIYLRFATREEYEFIRQNMYNSIPETSGHLYSKEELRRKEDIYEDFQVLTARGDRIKIAEISGDMAGYIHYGKIKDTYLYSDMKTHGHLYDLYIFPNFRRKGIATLMLSDAERDLKKEYLHMISAVTAINLPSWHFLREKGFIPKRCFFRISEPPRISDADFKTMNAPHEELLNFSTYLQKEFTNLSAVMYKLTEVLENGASLAIIGERQRTGFAIYSVFDDLLTKKRMGYIEFIYVIPEFRKKGIGRALLAYACQKMFSNLAEEIYIESLLDNHCSSFLKSFGFREFSFWLEKTL